MQKRICFVSRFPNPLSQIADLAFIYGIINQRWKAPGYTYERLMIGWVLECRCQPRLSVTLILGLRQTLYLLNHAGHYTSIPIMIKPGFWNTNFNKNPFIQCVYESAYYIKMGWLVHFFGIQPTISGGLYCWSRWLSRARLNSWRRDFSCPIL